MPPSVEVYGFVDVPGINAQDDCATKIGLDGRDEEDGGKWREGEL